MGAGCETVSLEFGCSPEKVWAVFTDARRYEEWYGYPRALEIVEVDPAFAPGGKLSFRGMRGTSVITAFEPCRRYAVSSSVETNEFEVQPSADGCRVSLTTTLNGDTSWRGTAAARSRANREILHRLRRAAGFEYDAGEPAPSVAPAERPSFFRTLFSGMLLGYKNPFARRAGGAQGSAERAGVMDNTEAGVVIHRAAALAGAAMCAALFAVLAVSVRFPLADVVPSSGMSIYHSEKVDKAAACAIYIGESRDALEIALSCAGTRLEADKYVYYSDEEQSAFASARIYVVYDAYGKVRRFGYIDGELASQRAEIAVRDLGTALADAGSPADAERAAGLPLSSFWTDKNGVTVVRFGLLDASRGVFDPLPLGQLEISLSGSSGRAVAEYYAPHDPNDPLPQTVYGDKLTRQYNNDSFYVADRIAYERMYMLLGLTRVQADLVLGTEGVDYAAAANSSVTATYSVRSRASDEAQYRYRYDVTFDFSDVAVAVGFRNRQLASRSGVLLGASEYALREGMTLSELHAELGILPTSALLTESSLTLGYGAALGDYDGARLQSELTVTLDGANGTVSSYEFSE